MLAKSRIAMMILGILAIAILACGGTESSPTSTMDGNSLPIPTTESAEIAPKIGDNSVLTPAKELAEVASRYKVVFGEPLEMGEFIAFNSKDGQGDQIKFTLDNQHTQWYIITADLEIEEVNGDGFTVLLDTPEGVKTVTFWKDRTVRVWSPVTPASSLTSRGSFPLSTKIHLSIFVDLIGNSWDVTVTEGNQTLAHYKNTFGATQVQSVRISTPVYENPEPVKAIASNIVINSSH